MNEQSEPTTPAPAARVGFFSSAMFKQMLIGLIPTVIGAAITVYVTITVMGIEQRNDAEKTEANTVLLASHDHRLNSHDVILGQYEAEGLHNRKRLEDVEAWQIDQGRRIRAFYETQWPKVEATLVSIGALQREIDALRRELRRSRR